MRNNLKSTMLSFIPKRYILSGLIFAGFVIMSGLRANLNVAIGAMINNHTINVDGTDIVKPAEFKWNSRMEGFVLGAFYYGYMVFQIPGGVLAMRFGGAKLFGVGIGIASILTLLTPVAARLSPIAVIVLRIGEGLALGSLFPCNHAIWSHWAPPEERTTLVTVSVAGTSVGYLITMPISGILTKYGFDGGWGSVFYCFGVFGLLWYMIWLLCVHETPDEHPTMSDEERAILSHNDKDLRAKVHNAQIPWTQILKSAPVWAIIAANFALDWSFYVLLISLPKFLVEIFDTEIHKMGFMAAAPFLVKGICTPLAGLGADILRKYSMSTKNVRRCFYAVGSLFTGLFILVAGYTNSVIVVIVCMSISGATTSISYPAYTVNMLDIAPRCASVIMGLCNTLGTTAGFLSPMLVGFVTSDQTLEEWRIVFWVNAIVSLLGSALFCVFLAAERQDWDKETNNDKNDEEAPKNIETHKPS